VEVIVIVLQARDWSVPNFLPISVDFSDVSYLVTGLCYRCFMIIVIPLVSFVLLSFCCDVSFSNMILVRSKDRAMAQAVWSPNFRRPFSRSGHPLGICGVQGGTGVYFSLVHPALVLRPS